MTDISLNPGMQLQISVNLTNEWNVANGKSAVTFTPKDYSAKCVVISKTSSMSLEGETTHGIDDFQPLDDLISPTYIAEHPIFLRFSTLLPHWYVERNVLLFLEMLCSLQFVDTTAAFLADFSLGETETFGSLSLPLEMFDLMSLFSSTSLWSTCTQ